MKEFSELTLKKISKTGGYYVYGLIDTRDSRLFYIGKGCGNRVFHHVMESNKNPESEKKKLQIIQEIEIAGYHVKHILIHWGLSESEAFAAEASLINLMNYISDISLSNIVAGHHTEGCMTTEDIEKKYGAEILDKNDFSSKTLIIKVNKLFRWDMTEEEIYDIVRGVWRADLDKVKKVQYVLGVYNNLIIGCYKPDEWYRVSDGEKNQLPVHIQDKDLNSMKNRVFFVVRNLEQKDERQKFYLYKSIEGVSSVQKSQNPITYIE